MAILITGALGYIAIHLCQELLNQGFEIIMLDNLSNNPIENLKCLNSHSPIFYPIDIRDEIKLRKVFESHSIDIVFHFAALKSVPESITQSLSYYDNNVSGTITLLSVMKDFECKKIIFSSSACVYKNSSEMHNEDEKIFVSEICNPYGKTKYMIEEIIKDSVISYGMQCIVLRYFNPVGIQISNFKLPKYINNLMDVILDSIISNKTFTIFGRDYETRDGTCIRDFIHIFDLVSGHICAMKYLEQNSKQSEEINKSCKCFEIFNLGNGIGVTVLELVETFQKVNQIQLNYEFGERRLNDVFICLADSKKAKNKIGWKPLKTLEDMCRDSFSIIHKKNQN
jgi:UDP-glucose 4-epimerase